MNSQNNVGECLSNANSRVSYWIGLNCFLALNCKLTPTSFIGVGVDNLRRCRPFLGSCHCNVILHNIVIDLVFTAILIECNVIGSVLRKVC